MFFDSLNETSRKAPAVTEISRDALLRSAPGADKESEVKQTPNSSPIPVNSIAPNPNQPRKKIDEDGLAELISSIKRHGLMQPITVRQVKPFEYELIAGHRRLEAVKRLGEVYIQAVVIEAEDKESAVMALVENIQRENLGYMEEAEAYAALISEQGITQEQLAKELGKTQSTIANKIRLLKLSPKVRKILADNNLTERHARALLKLHNEKERVAALEIIVSKKLNVAKTEELVERLIKKNKKKPESRENAAVKRTFKDVRIFANTLKQAVEMMRRSGVDAVADKNETDRYIEYTIKIPKHSD
ncbi:MAG TPA: ParB/RepB/Spo0J family partition protein [Firmicutes bacterium]|nr:ParB/RepB/Spo0J family partition protein [Bacillota bacterium]